MKSIAGKVVSSRPISLSKAAKFLRHFVSVETEASHAVSAYLRRTSTSFNELTQLHRQLRGTRFDGKHKKDRSHKLSCENLGKNYHESLRDPGPTSGVKSIVDLVPANSMIDGENGSVRNKEKKRIEGGESAEREGSIDLGLTLESNPSMDSARKFSVGIDESSSVRKKGNKKEKRIVRGGSANKSENRVEIVKFGGRDGENEGISHMIGVKQGKIEEEIVEIEMRKKKKRKTIEAAGVGNDASQERHSSMKKRRRIEGDD